MQRGKTISGEQAKKRRKIKNALTGYSFIFINVAGVFIFGSYR